MEVTKKEYSIDEKLDMIMQKQEEIMMKLEKIDDEHDYDYIKQGLVNVLSDVISEEVIFKGILGRSRT